MSRLRVCTTALVVLIGFCTSTYAEVHTTGVPQLSSRPGARYTIYLNFAGFNFTGKWGGDTNRAPGNMVSYGSVPANESFKPFQQRNIEQIFARTAEKYAGMSVNVTTIDPAVAAGKAGTDAQRQAYYDSQAQMMHTVITDEPRSNEFVTASGKSFSGVTQNSYGTSANNGAGWGYHTNWVFDTNVGSVNGIAETAAHENGHGLKLNHQSAFNGTTRTQEYSSNGNSSRVRPIMGGSVSGGARGVWRVGPQESGSTDIQNDIAGLMSNRNMAFADDQVGHTIATATPLKMTGNQLTIGANSGFIVPKSSTGFAARGEDSYTKDYYSFSTSGGTINVTINESNDLLQTGVADGHGTLDSRFRLLRANGTLVQLVQDPTSQTSTLNASIPAGDYFLYITSAGGKDSEGTESADYFDMGSYFLSGTIPQVVPEPGTLLTLGAIGIGLLRRRR